MKLSKKVISCILSIVSLTSLFSCAHDMQSDVTEETEFDGFYVQPSAYIQLEESLSDCIEKADLIVMGTITNVGTAFLPENLSLHARMSDMERKDVVAQIQTPVTCSVQTVYKNNSTSGDVTTYALEEDNSTLTWNETYGVIDNAYKLYPLENQIELQKNMTCVLFIKIINGKFHILHQPSILLKEDGQFQSLLSNNELYTNCDGNETAIALIQELLNS